VVLAAALLAVVGAPSAGAITTVPAQIAVTLSPSSPAVGQDVRVTAVAKDSLGQTMTSFSVPASWSDRSGALSPGAPADFVNGVSTTVAHIDRAFHGDVISVTAGTTGTSRAFNVLGPLDHLTTSIPSGPKVDTPFNVTISARDAVNNLLTGYTGALAWSDSAGALPAPSAFAGGVSTTSVQLANPVHNDRLTITTGGLSVTRSFNVIGPVTKLDLSAPSSVAPATPFKIVASARDAAGNVVPDYNAPASWIDSAGALTPSTPSAFVKGVSTTVAQFPTPVTPDVVTLSTGAFSAHRTITAVGPLDHVALTWTTASAGYLCSSVTGSLVARAVDAALNQDAACADRLGIFGHEWTLLCQCGTGPEQEGERKGEMQPRKHDRLRESSGVSAEALSTFARSATARPRGSSKRFHISLSVQNCFLLSRSTVTGPSLTSATAIVAWNRPAATVTPLDSRS
jgi:hypothetical protein